jgi:hypothetical protein
MFSKVFRLRRAVATSLRLSLRSNVGVRSGTVCTVAQVTKCVVHTKQRPLSTIAANGNALTSIADAKTHLPLSRHGRLMLRTSPPVPSDVCRAFEIISKTVTDAARSGSTAVATSSVDSKIGQQNKAYDDYDQHPVTREARRMHLTKDLGTKNLAMQRLSYSLLNLM